MLANSPRLPYRTAEAISAAEKVYVSPVVGWEIAAKRGAGHLKVPENIPLLLTASRFTELPVTLPHAWRAGELPWHHRDPFDRLLVAQALCEKLTIVTVDRKMQGYNVETL